MRITYNLFQFIKSQQFSGLLLVIATLISLLVANSLSGDSYIRFWASETGFTIGSLNFHHSISHWINDGLMAIFFLLVALEIKRELFEGELASLQKALLPVTAAVGGMIVPALLFALFNFGKPTLSGFGIPMATDIAFAVGVLSLLGKKVPIQLKIFLLALAVIDDLGAIIVIAIFYASNFSLYYFSGALLVTGILFLLNRLKVHYLWIYAILGLVLWYFVSMSGIHATIAGVVLAFTIPGGYRNEYTQTERLENALNIPVNYLIMPLFALANTAIPLGGEILSTITTQLGLGVMMGLVIGKPIGILAASYVTVKIGMTRLPDNLGWSHILGAGILGGVGFTMSIFISMLAFKDSNLQDGAKISVLVASVMAGIIGFIYLKVILKNKAVIDVPIIENKNENEVPGLI